MKLRAMKVLGPSSAPTSPQPDYLHQYPEVHWKRRFACLQVETVAKRIACRVLARAWYHWRLSTFLDGRGTTKRTGSSRRIIPSVSFAGISQGDDDGSEGEFRALERALSESKSEDSNISVTLAPSIDGKEAESERKLASSPRTLRVHSARRSNSPALRHSVTVPMGMGAGDDPKGGESSPLAQAASNSDSHLDLRGNRAGKELVQSFGHSRLAARRKSHLPDLARFIKEQEASSPIQTERRKSDGLITIPPELNFDNVNISSNGPESESGRGSARRSRGVNNSVSSNQSGNKSRQKRSSVVLMSVPNIIKELEPDEVDGMTGSRRGSVESIASLDNPPSDDDTLRIRERWQKAIQAVIQLRRFALSGQGEEEGGESDGSSESDGCLPSRICDYFIVFG